MSVYFLKAQGLIKIGYSANAARRVEAVLAPFGDEGEVVGIMPGDRALETFLHSKFAAHRAHGEWFQPHADIVDFIALMGAPTQAPPDKEDDRSLLQMYEDKYAEDSADALHAAKKRCQPDEDFFLTVAKWSGISAKRLQQIYLGRADVVTAAEYTLCRALGEQAGFHPSMLMDGTNSAIHSNRLHVERAALAK